MAWFDETCITSDNIDMNDCRRINCVSLLHCTCIEAVIDMIGGCNLTCLKMNNKTSLGFLGFMYLLFRPSKQINLNIPNAPLKPPIKWTIFYYFLFQRII